MRLLVLAALLVAAEILGNLLWLVIEPLLVDRASARRPSRAVPVVAAAALALVAFTLWFDETSHAPSQPSPVSQSVVDPDSGITPSTVLAPEPDPRVANCGEARAMVGEEDPTLPTSVSSVDGLRVQAEVANVTCGDSTYSPSIGAVYDQVVKFEALYGLESSSMVGEDLYITLDSAQVGNVTLVSIDVAAAGRSIRSSAAVYLGRSDARLEYIPGSVTWRRNEAPAPAPSQFHTQSLDDAGFNHPYLLTRLEQGEAGHGSVAALFRVVIPAIGIRFEARQSSVDDWKQTLTAHSGRSCDLRIVIENLGNDYLRDLLIRISLPPRGLTLIDDSAVRLDEDGEFIAIADGTLLSSGVPIGDLPPGGRAEIQMRGVIASSLKAGSELRAVGVTKWLGGNEFYNTVALLVPH